MITNLCLQFCMLGAQFLGPGCLDAPSTTGSGLGDPCPWDAGEAGIARAFRDETEVSFYAYDPFRDVEAYGYYDGDVLVVGAAAATGAIEVTLASDGTLLSYTEDGDAARVLGQLVWLGYPGARQASGGCGVGTYLWLAAKCIVYVGAGAATGGPAGGAAGGVACVDDVYDTVNDCYCQQYPNAQGC